MGPAMVFVDPAEDVAYWRARTEQLENELADANARIAKLTEQVATLSRMMFGRSSERGGRSGAVADPDQELDDEAETDSADDRTGQAPDNGKPKQSKGQQRGSRGHGRRDYSHLPTVEVVHDVPAEQRFCSCCGLEFEAFDAERSEQLDWQVHVTRIVHKRLRYRRRCGCPGKRTVTAPPVANPVPKGHLTAGFLARLLFDKYVLCLPVNRIMRSLAAEGLDLAAGSLCGALRSVAGLLAPLYDAIVAHNAAAVHAHIDETSWRVFEHDEEGHGHRWWLWVFLTADTVVFTIDPTRSTAVVEAHFGVDRDDAALADGRRLLISSDFYAAYQCLARIDGVHPLWCWAHIRRRFIRAGDAHRELRVWSDAWVARIADLYTAHTDLAAAELGTTAHTEAQKAFDQALDAIDTARHDEIRNADLMHPTARKALETLNREWDGLAAHRDFPDLPLDNNPAERALRTPVIGRKNSYGSHARWAADLAAMAWTATATAERNHREPLAYLTDYLNACAQAGGKPPEGAALDQFLPWKPDPDNPTGSRDHNPHPATQPNPQQPASRSP
jgi:transposase